MKKESDITQKEIETWMEIYNEYGSLKKSKCGKYPKIRYNETPGVKVYYIEVSKGKVLKTNQCIFFSMILPNKYELLIKYWRVPNKSRIIKKFLKKNTIISYEENCKSLERYLLKLILFLIKFDPDQVIRHGEVDIDRSDL